MVFNLKPVSKKAENLQIYDLFSPNTLLFDSSDDRYEEAHNLGERKTMGKSNQKTDGQSVTVNKTHTNNEPINVQQANEERSAIKEYFEINIPKAFPNSEYGYDENLETFKRALNFLCGLPERCQELIAAMSQTDILATWYPHLPPHGDGMKLDIRGLFSYLWDENGIFGGFIEKISKCESPIEKLFYIAYCICVSAYNYRVFSGYSDSRSPFEYDDIYPFGSQFELKPQAEISLEDKKYRADFLFDTDQIYLGKHWVFKRSFKLIVECDGHEFHEKTKKQVAQGNKRDLELKKHGYDVLHFSGSQIHNEPLTCAHEVIEYILSGVEDIIYVEEEIAPPWENNTEQK